MGVGSGLLALFLLKAGAQETRRAANASCCGRHALPQCFGAARLPKAKQSLPAGYVELKTRVGLKRLVSGFSQPISLRTPFLNTTFLNVKLRPAHGTEKREQGSERHRVSR